MKRAADRGTLWGCRGFNDEPRGDFARIDRGAEDATATVGDPKPSCDLGCHRGVKHSWHDTGVECQSSP
jgi:hypothetical protein